MNFSMLHCADLGLKNLPFGGINPLTGMNRRFEDIDKNFHFIVSEAIRRKCKFFVIAGDINEERNPESLLIEKFSGHVADLISQGITVIIVAGNHDADSAKGTSTSVSYLKSLGLVDVYIADRRPERFEFEDVVFHCLPTMYPSSLGLKSNDDLSKYLDKHIKEITLHPKKQDVLVSHYSLDVTFEGLGVDEPVLRVDSLSKFDYVALGHIHKYEMFSSFRGGYTGSLFVKDFGEQFDKYVNVIGFKEKSGADIIRISVPERRFLQFDIDGMDATPEELFDRITKAAQNIKDAIVKIRVTTRKRSNPKLIYKWLREQGVFHFTPVDWKLVRDETVKRIEVAKGTSDADIIKAHLKDKDYSKEMKKKIKDYIGQTITKWDESQTIGE
jgi:exonuclease SbcD